MDGQDSINIYHHILMGVPKEQSEHVKGPESSDKWDKLAGEVAAIRKNNPIAHFETPNELPQCAIVGLYQPSNGSENQ